MLAKGILCSSPYGVFEPLVGLVSHIVRFCTAMNLYFVLTDSQIQRLYDANLRLCDRPADHKFDEFNGRVNRPKDGHYHVSPVLRAYFRRRGLGTSPKATHLNQLAFPKIFNLVYTLAMVLFTRKHLRKCHLRTQ